MFQFRRFPTYAYFIQRRLTEYCSAGFPHSVIHGSTRMCRSPWLIAACHDLLRLLMPRHSPCALSSLTSSEQAPYPSSPAKAEDSLIPLLLLSLADPLRWGPLAFRKARSDTCSVRVWKGQGHDLELSSQRASLVLNCSERIMQASRDLWLIVLPIWFHNFAFGSSVACFTFLECFFVVQFSRCASDR